MKNLLLFIALSLCLPFGKATAQSLPPLQPEQDACNALPLCGGIFSTPYSYTGFGAIQEQNQFSPSNGCFDESNSVWLKLTVATPGLIAFTIAPVNTTNDYDFAVYNITGTTCNNITAANRVRCNGCDIFSSPNGLTGLSLTGVGVVSGPGPGPNFISAINAAAGDVYLIMIDNFNTGASVAGFSIDFSASTATFVQPPSAKFASLNPACDKSSGVTVHLTKNVQCNSIAPNGSDFSLSPSGTIVSAAGVNCTPNGYTSDITLTFSPPLAPGSYVLHAQTGTDNNTLLDFCNNPLLLPDTLQFVVTPNTLLMTGIDTPACYKTRITLNGKIKCNTVAANGSDFLVSGPSTVAVAKAVPVGCDALGMTDTIDLFFNRSIPVAGNYTLSVTVGTDGNSVLDTCGHAINNTISWKVTDQGYVTALATPPVLCKKDYVQLTGIPGINPPQGVKSCGGTGIVPPGAALDYTFGTGTTTSGVYPLSGFYSDVRTQILFKRSELRAQGLTEGTITKMALKLQAKNSSIPYTGFTVKLACVGDTFLSGFMAVPMTIVYTPKNFNSVLGVNNIVFDIPYNWDTNSSLLVEMCYDNTVSGSYDYTYNSVSSFNSTVYANASTGSGCNLTVGTVTANRPNIVFSQVPSPAPLQTFLWTPGEFVGDSTLDVTPAFVPATRIYQVQIVDSNYCYRRDTAKVIVSVRNPQILSPVGDTALCIGDSLKFIATGGITYAWTPATGLDCPTCSDPMATPLTTTTYTVTIADQYGCSDEVKRKITIHPLPVVYAGKDTSILYGTQLQLIAQAPGGMFYLWDPITYLNNPNIADPIATPEVTTWYSVRVIDTNRCENRDTIKVKVRTDIPVNIPNAFSPNGDGKNDVFKPGNMIFQKLVEFRVFNRWGIEVFSTTDPSKGWDGTYRGAKQDLGTYEYIIRVGWPDGKIDTYKGDVELIR